jgi:hypothetical protein
MRTTLDLDEDILRAARDRADATGRTTGEVISEMARRGFDLAPVERMSARDGILDLRLDPSIEITPDTIDELLDSIEHDDDLGLPLAIDDFTRQEVRRLAREQHMAPGKVAANLVQEALLLKGTWPLRNGVAVFPSRGREPLTLKDIEALLDER